MMWNSREDEAAFYVSDSAESKSNRGRKCVVILLSLALVAVLLAICVPVTLSLKGQTDSNDDLTVPAPVTAACAATQYLETCTDTLRNSSHADALDFTQTTIITASQGLDETRLAVLQSQTPEIAHAVQVCLDVLGTAAEEMAAVIEALNSTDLTGAFDDIKTRVTAAMEFHTTCIDTLQEVMGADVAASVRATIAKTNELFSVALSFVNALSKFGDNLRLWATNIFSDQFSDHHRRRLLTEDDDIPEWIGIDQRRHLLQTKPAVPRPYNVTVAQDRSGDFTKIMDALKKAPLKSKSLYVIYIKKGVYKEQVTISNSHHNIMFLGEDSRYVIFTGSLSVALTKNMTTFNSATLIIEGTGFLAQGITVQNTAGAQGHQAVAVRVSADNVAFYRCSFDSFQDTLYAHTYRQYYRDCQIWGTVDFVFGNSFAVFQNCRLLAKKSTIAGQTNIYTAQGKTDRAQGTGLSFQSCVFDATSELQKNQKKFPTFLGRPWKPYSTAILLRCSIQGHVDPKGWMPWNASDYGLKTSYFGEFQSLGAGGKPTARVPWSKQIKSLAEANRFQAGRFIQGNRWVPYNKFPNFPYTGAALT